MKTKINLLLLVVSTTIVFFSCKKEDETSKPQIISFELGYQDSKLATLGNDLHIEAEVVADGKISTIQVTIHPEGDHEEKSTMVFLDEEEWEFDSVYTEFSGLKNTTFHKHVDIPVIADTGTYHFHFIVTDMEGNQTELEEEVRIEQPDDSQAPVITITSAPASGQAFSNGAVIPISGSVTDDQFLGGLYIGLVREGQSLDDASVNANNTITLLHTHDFDSPTGHSFTASITVGAAQDNNDPPKDITGDIAWQSGNYYILVKSKDAFGGNWAYSSHYPVVINY
jgi:Domain of unknown function (DUF4625)